MKTPSLNLSLLIWYVISVNMEYLKNPSKFNNKADDIEAIAVQAFFYSFF